MLRNLFLLIMFFGFAAEAAIPEQKLVNETLAKAVIDANTSKDIKSMLQKWFTDKPKLQKSVGEKFKDLKAKPPVLTQEGNKITVKADGQSVQAVFEARPEGMLALIVNSKTAVLGQSETVESIFKAVLPLMNTSPATGQSPFWLLPEARANPLIFAVPVTAVLGGAATLLKDAFSSNCHSAYQEFMGVTDTNFWPVKVNSCDDTSSSVELFDHARKAKITWTADFKENEFIEWHGKQKIVYQVKGDKLM